MEFGHLLDVDELLRQSPSSVRRLARRANATRGRRSTSARSATVGSLSVCQFDLDDEEAAFAYAEERVRAATSRLAVTNRSCELVARTQHGNAGTRCRRASCGACRIVLCTTIVDGSPATPSADGPSSELPLQRILEQYNHFEWRILAVRGERLICTGAVGRMSPGTRRRTYTWSRSATTGCRSTRAASTRTTSRAPTANSSGATTPAKARRSPSPVRLSTNW